MGLGDILILAAVAAALIGALAFILKNGGFAGGCGGDCAHCGGCGAHNQTPHKK